MTTPVPEAIAQRGAHGPFIVLTDPDTRRGHIVDVQVGKVYPEGLVDSFAARGYWDDVTDTLLAEVAAALVAIPVEAAHGTRYYGKRDSVSGKVWAAIRQRPDVSSHEEWDSSEMRWRPQPWALDLDDSVVPLSPEDAQSLVAGSVVSHLDYCAAENLEPGLHRRIAEGHQRRIREAEDYAESWRSIGEGQTVYEAVGAYDAGEIDLEELTRRVTGRVKMPWGHDGDGWTDSAVAEPAPDSVDWIHRSRRLTPERKSELERLLIHAK